MSHAALVYNDYYLDEISLWMSFKCNLGNMIRNLENNGCSNGEMAKINVMKEIARNVNNMLKQSLY